MRTSVLLFAVLFAAAVSCGREEPTLLPEESSTIHYRITVNSGESTRATVNGGMHYVFEDGDRLYMSGTGDAAGKIYGYLDLISGAGTTTASFEGDLVGVDEFKPASDTPINVTLVSSGDRIHTTGGGKLTGTAYPSNEYGTTLADAVEKFSNFTCNTTFGTTRVTLTQQSTFLVFTVSFKRTEVAVSTPITAKIFNNSEATPVWQNVINAAALGSGRSRVDFVVAFPGGSTSLTDAELSVIWGDGANDHKEFAIDDKDLAVNHYYKVSRTTIDLGNPFHIRAKEDGTYVTFKYTKATGGIQYICYDLGVDDWTDYDGSTLALSKDYVVYFKGTRTDCDCNGATQLFTANENKVCYIGGNITSLTNGVLATNAFRSAFSYGDVSDQNAEKEKNIPVATGTVYWVDIDSDDPLILPESTAAFCYTEMFLGCTSLHYAPALPATELADKCYFRMFYNCPGLSSIPVFPSVVTMSGTSNRRRYCFQMFQSCTGIKKLEGSLFGGTMTLQANCFEDMFANCTGLTSVDKDFLPATTLAPSCYRGMFQNTRFDTAPDLLVGTLVEECYRFMFNGCTKLKNIRCLATTNLGNGYTTNWVGGNVPNNNECTFVRAENINWPRNANGILDNWTIQNDTPLP